MQKTAAVTVTLALSIGACLAHAATTWTKPAAGVLQDSTTGLQWTQSDNGANVDEANAAAYCETLPTAGGGWRLPETEELQQIIATSGGTTACNGLACKLPQEFRISGNFAWTASGSHMGARRVNLITGSTGQALPSESTYTRAICVRSPPPATAAAPAMRAESASPATTAHSAPAATNGRWAASGNGVLKDQTTGLEWTQRNNGRNVPLAQAQAWCSALTTASGGWRLPEAAELQALVSVDATNKCGNLIPCKVSPQFQITEYRFWSSTPAAPIAGHPAGTIVSLIDGKASPWQSDFANRVVCTRSARN